jgi:hypothetical protein
MTEASADGVPAEQCTGRGQAPPSTEFSWASMARGNVPGLQAMGRVRQVAETSRSHPC